jgi:molecular chaperone DnaJ
MPTIKSSRVPIASWRCNTTRIATRATRKPEERFKEAAEAYGVLSNTETRARYDRFGHAGIGTSAASEGGWPPGDFGGFEDILGDIFGDLFGGRSHRRGGAQRGSDLRYDLEITLEQSAAGYKTQINIPRLESCEPCKGSGAAPGHVGFGL